MNSKVLKALKEKGYDKIMDELTTTELTAIISETFRIKVVSEWTDEANYYLYEDTSADGYCLYVFTDNTQALSLRGDVYHYMGDVANDLQEYIMMEVDYERVIYVEDNTEYYYTSAIEQLYEEKRRELIEEIENKL